MASQLVGHEHADPIPSLGWLNAGIIHLDLDGWLTVYNDLAITLLDIDVPLQTPVRLLDCLSADREEYKLLHHIASSRAEVRNQLITWAESGQICHVLIDSYMSSSVQPHGLNDKASGIYVMMKNLGDFVLLDQHLQRTDKLAVVGKVAAGVAHEIRNPLTTVRGFLQVMMNRLEAREMDEEQAYLEMMVGEVDKVEGLVKELLLLSKPHRAVRHECELGQLVTRLRPSIEEKAQDKEIKSEFVIEENLPSIIGDDDLLTHVILQLTENALDAMDAEGCLTVRASKENNLVRLDIHDTGPGIPYYQMDQVFDAFFTTKDKGTGLGLPICKKIVADHGGEIRVSSKGFGTTFSVLLPTKQEAL